MLNIVCNYFVWCVCVCVVGTLWGCLQLAIYQFFTCVDKSSLCLSKSRSPLSIDLSSCSNYSGTKINHNQSWTNSSSWNLKWRVWITKRVLIGCYYVGSNATLFSSSSAMYPNDEWTRTLQLQRLCEFTSFCTWGQSLYVLDQTKKREVVVCLW